MPNFTGLWTQAQQLQARASNIWPAVPGAPTSVTATAGNASASVAFTAPTETGYPANAITGYTVTSSPGSFTATGASSPLTVVGLTNGTAYTFTVRATNAAGTGPASAASSSVTPVDPGAFIENIFSNWVYVGNGSTQDITNGINLATFGGMVWMKSRSSATTHRIFDTTGRAGILSSDTSNGENEVGAYPTHVFGLSNGTGFRASSVVANSNASNVAYTSWTFRKQPKFFDMVTYTGNGTSRNISHNLGSVPGCIIVKSLGGASQGGADGFWFVYHRGLSTPQSGAVFLNNTEGRNTAGTWANTLPTSTQFTVASGDNTTNINGRQYVAYIFAHDAGGFGTSGNENVISCGSFTTDGSGNATVSLGYEAQWVITKRVDSTSDWVMLDNMRGWAHVGSGGGGQRLKANTAEAESADGIGTPLATGFSYLGQAANATYIYIAIRRGPMAVPTTGTSVFNVQTTANGTLSPSMSPDAVFNYNLASTAGWQVADRLRGFLLGFPSNTSGATTSNPYLVTNSTAAESTSSCRIGGLGVARAGSIVGSNVIIEPGVIGSGNYNTAYWFKRAPSFFDVVCYTGTGGVGNLPITHGLGAIPELVIIKNRSNTGQPWSVHSNSFPASRYLQLNLTNAFINDTVFGTADDTTTTFNTTGTTQVNAAANTYVAYLFATCPGVSKVGSYTGNGSSQTIACGFTAGARFVLIKRTDSSGDWYVLDTARGIITGNDPHLSLNTTSAEVATNDTIDPDSSGFIVNQLSATNINVNTATYIFLAIA